jgi:hypothetical protein
MDYGVTGVWGAKAKSIGVAGFLPRDDRLGLPEIEDEQRRRRVGRRPTKSVGNERDEDCRGRVQHVEVEFPWF